MTQARGSASSVSLYDETTLGTADGTTGLLLPLISYNVMLSQPLRESRVLRNSRNPTIPYLDEMSIGGSMVIQPDVRSAVHVFRHAIGVPVTAGSIGTPVVSNGGSGYTSAPTVAFTGGGGSGAAATAVLTGDAVTSLTITNAGSGYTSAPTVSFSGGDGTGAAATVSLAAPFVHEYKIGDLPVGMTLEPYFANITEALQHAGCRVNGFSFEVGSAGCLEMNLDIVGIHETNEARMDSAPVAYSAVPLRHGLVTLTQGGSGLLTATNFGVNFTNEIEQVRTIGNQGRIYSLPEGFGRPTGSLTVLFESMTQYDKAKNETEDSLKLTWPSAPTGSGHQLEMEWQEVRYAVSGPPIPGPGGISAALDWFAHYDNGSEASAMVVRITNDLAAAAVTAIPT